MGMIKSCADCKSVCCKTGPGPYTVVTPGEYLEGFGETSGYNTKCMALSDGGSCNLWGTPKFPIECRTYICQSREYTAKELKNIDEVRERDCLVCGAEWQYMVNKDNGEWSQVCPVCKEKYIWKRKKNATT